MKKNKFYKSEAASLASEIWQEEQRFENPHKHYLDMSPDYYDMKMSLLHNLRG